MESEGTFWRKRGRISVAWAMSILTALAIMVNVAQAGMDVSALVSNIDENGKQSALDGKIDSLVITRGAAEFRLGPGTVTLFDFGSGRTAAMVYVGSGRFLFAPPDDVERGQLRKFTRQDTLNNTFTMVVFWYTVELDNPPDTASFVRGPVSGDAWKALQESRDDAFDHLKIHIPNKLVGDLLAGGPGTYFHADFELENIGHLIFIEDPAEDDQYRLYAPTTVYGVRTFDVLAGYTPEHNLVSQRGILPIDVTRYFIDSRIEGSGKMKVSCRIEFTPMRWGQRFVYLTWYGDNKILSASDSNGDSLYVINRKDEPGFGLVLNKPLEVGQKDSISIAYQCKSLENIWGVYYMSISGNTFWYPWSHFGDQATYDMRFDCPKSYQVIACGDAAESSIQEGRSLSRWTIDKPVLFSSFNIGDFDTREFNVANIPTVKVFISKTIPHDEIALLLARQGELSSADMEGRVGADVTNSMAFFTSLFGDCPFDTIRVTEIPMEHGQGPPGLIHLSWLTFQQESMAGSDEQFRAHEVAHQWWGHVVNNESYRDTWLMEGLAEYCGFWYFQMSSKNMGVCKTILEKWREYISDGLGTRSVGSKAGPIVLGPRLISSKSDDYSVLVYKKGAYVFHMLRYLMHDFKTNSDGAFGAFLKDLAARFRGRPITTEKFQKFCEDQVGGDMGWFFNQWVYGTAIPEYRFRYKSAPTPEGKYKVTCHVKQEKVPADFKMMIPITVLFDDDRFIHLKIWVDQPEMDVELPSLPYKPEKIVFNTYESVLCKVKYE